MESTNNTTESSLMLLGKRILVSRPEMPKSSIELTPEVQAQIDAVNMKMWTKLVVFEVGTDVERVKKGNQVYVPASRLGSAEPIEIDGQIKMMIGENDIAIIW